MANNTKKINFSAFQFDLHKINVMKDSKSTTKDYTVNWNSEFVNDLLNNVFSTSPLGRKLNIKDEWFLLLDDLHSDDEYMYGKYQSTLYGTVGDLVHADTLASRKNPKQIREGEENFSHFIIRKKDGLMLIQTTYIKVNRTRIQNYIEKYGEGFIKDSVYDNINICSLVSMDLIEHIKQLDTVKSTVIEISTEEKSNENEFVQELQDEIDSIKGTHVSLEFKAKYSREGLGA